MRRSNTIPPRSSRRTSKRNAKNRLTKMSCMKKILKWGGLTCISLLVVCMLTLLYLRSHALPQITLQQTSLIVDRHGNWLDSYYHEQNRSVVKLADISPYLIQATLSIEDHRFYEHFGIDFKAILRAIWINLTHRKMVQGASTITQQLARNSYLSHERTWSRKWKESIYAIQLELQYNKQEILEKYLNHIYYGHSTYGIEMASQMFFGKSAKHLNLAESALLAGIPKGPLYYSPYHQMKRAKDRQKIVLQTMVRNHYISQHEADSAFKSQLGVLPQTHRQEKLAPYFRDYIKSQAMQHLALSETQFEESGYKVYTTLDSNMQLKAEKTIKKYIEPFSELQVALIAIDPRNGFIQAMVGGRDYENNQFNRVFSQTRQTGSAFKPFVYLTALLQGHTPLTAYKSEPTVFTYEDGKKTYTPKNFGNQYFHDYIQMRQAIASSDNMYAVNTLLNLGFEPVIEIAHKLGIQSKLQALPSLALGTSPISPFEMALAYGVLANQGIKVNPIAILKIEDPHGKVVYQSTPHSELVVDEAPAYVLTHLMQSVFSPGGSAHRAAHLIKRPVAGKTGSTNVDTWMVGYTPELSTAVWLGYDKDRMIGNLESHLASPIFAEFTEQALQDIPAQTFHKPEGVISVEIDPVSGKLANEDCPHSRLESFVIGTQPTEYCTASEKNKPPDKSQNPPEHPEPDSWWKNLFHWWST